MFKLRVIFAILVFGLPTNASASTEPADGVLDTSTLTQTEISNLGTRCYFDVEACKRGDALVKAAIRTPPSDRGVAIMFAYWAPIFYLQWVKALRADMHQGDWGGADVLVAAYPTLEKLVEALDKAHSGDGTLLYVFGANYYTELEKEWIFKGNLNQLSALDAKLDGSVTMATSVADRMQGELKLLVLAGINGHVQRGATVGVAADSDASAEGYKGTRSVADLAFADRVLGSAMTWSQWLSAHNPSLNADNLTKNLATLGVQRGLVALHAGHRDQARYYFDAACGGKAGTLQSCTNTRDKFAAQGK